MELLDGIANAVALIVCTPAAFLAVVIVIGLFSESGD